MSLYHIQLQLSTTRAQLYYNLTWAVSKGLSYEENVLQNILHLLKFTFWARSVIQLCFRWPPSFYNLHSRVNIFLQAGSSRTFWRTFCKNKIHIFLILAHQATKARAHGLFFYVQAQLYTFQVSFKDFSHL